ncbi:MAG: hypothetical protein IJ804_04885 [Prevotella sp.]|nr:hypothetical protein [Prevotella sp.]
MKRLLTTLLLAAAIGCLNASAATTAVQDEQEGQYSLKNGHLTMLIDAAHGGKILSFKYDDQEVLSQLKWPESFGSTFWTSPQKEWYWPPVPEYDKKPYTVEKVGDALKMTSEVNDKLKFRMRKEFAIDEQDQCIVITYCLINESEDPRQVAPWEITRVQNQGGLIFFESPVDSIWPAGLMNFQESNGIAWYQPDEAAENRKVNADGKGWLAYCCNGLLLVKRFTDLDATQPAPGEAEIQVYVNRGKTYIELESQGAYTTLQPKEELRWIVRWYLQPCHPDTQESLIQQVRNIAHP